MSVRPQNHVAPASAIAAIRAPFRHKFLAPKTDGSAAAVSCLCKNFDPIDEHGGFKLPSAQTRVIPSGVPRDPRTPLRAVQDDNNEA